MKTEPKTLPGFMELNPEDQIIFNKMVDTIRHSYEQYGFCPLDTPVIEYSSVLLAKAGGETEKQIYRFNKGDNDLSLRFDLTVPLAKYVSQKSNELVFPFKGYQIGKVYRGERPQKGRFREFYQCDIDVLGEDELSLMYDAEIPAVIYDIFKKLNIGDFVIRINNRKILNGLFSSLEISTKASDILRIIDKIEKIGEEEVIKELENLGLNKEKIDTIIKFINITGTNDEILNQLVKLNITDETFKLGLEELTTVINNLRLMKIDENNYEIDLTIARGLDYYTGTVYETKLKDYPSLGSICSGGRYDNLAEFYTDKKLPGVGISIGLTRLFYQLKEVGIIGENKEGSSDAIIVPMSEEYYGYIYDITNNLRNNNLKVNVCYLDKKFKNKMKYVNASKVKYAIIIGEDEVTSNKVTIKNMIDGTQDTINVNDVSTYIINSKN